MPNLLRRLTQVLHYSDTKLKVLISLVTTVIGTGHSLSVKGQLSMCER